MIKIPLNISDIVTTFDGEITEIVHGCNGEQRVIKALNNNEAICERCDRTFLLGAI